ncbi:putative ribonuclease H-like domain-containing protein [Tanacetum coccineum]
MVPRAVLMKSGLVSVNIARQVNAAHSKTTVNAARPMSYLSKTTHSTVKRPIHKNTIFKNSNINQRVNTIRDKNVNTARLKVVVNAVKGNNVNDVKASAFGWKQNQQFKTINETEPVKNYILLPLWTADLPFSQDPKSSHDDESKPSSDDGKKVDEDPRKESECNDQEKEDNVNNTNNVNAAGTNKVNAVGKNNYINKKDVKEFGGTWEEPKKVIHALKDPSWIEAMQEELLQFNAFLYGKIKEEVVCICPTTGSKDPDFPDRVYKVEKALYGLHQAPRAWYETLSTYLLDNGFQRGKIDKTLFIKRHKGDILLVQVYVDDIIFGSTKKELCNAFEKLMHEKFQMSSIGELTFFLGLQVQQKKDGIFISQDKYVDEILKKFGSMIGSLMYLTSSKPNIMFAVCACARYQVNPNVSQLRPVKRIFSLQQEVVNSLDVDSGKAKKSVRLMMEKLFGMELELILVKTVNGEAQLHALVDGKKIIINESTVRRDLQLKDAEGIDCLPNSTIFEELTRMGYEKILQKLTFYKPFFSPQWKFMIHTILQCLSAKTTAWDEFSSTMASAIICLATNQKFNFSKYSFESMVKNLDNVSGKFLMYPRFIQVFMNQQLDGLPSHKRIYDAPSHTKKIFRNMKRVGKGFSGRVTPLFPTMVVQNQSELGEGSAMPTDPHHTPTIIESSSQPQKTQKPKKPKRNDTQVTQSSSPIDIVADEAVHKELGDSLVRAATTAFSLEAEHNSGNISKTRSKATPNESSFLGTTSGGGPRRQETMRDTIAQTRFENVSKLSNDPLFARGNKLRSGEDSLKLTELMELFGLSTRVESSGDEESLGEDASKQARRINVIDADEDITLVNVQDDVEMFDVNTLIALKSVKPKVKGVVMQEPSTTTITISSQQLSHDKEIALKLQAEIDEKERIARDEEENIDEANIAWDDIQAKVYADYQLVERLQAEEEEQFTIEQKATLFKELLEKRRKYFAAKRA